MKLSPIKNDKHSLIPIDNLKKYANHPFKEYTGSKLDEMIASIKEHGVINPIIVRPIANQPDTYEIISGHNRVNAAKMAGKSSVPAIIRDIDDDTADMLVTETNFKQRNELLPSEKGKAYKMQLDVLKRQGKRNDLTSVQIEQKTGREQVAGMNNETASQIQRYIRLTFLIPELMDAVDDRKVALTVGVNVSYLRESEQQLLSEILSGDNSKLSIAQSAQLKEASGDHELNRNEIVNTLKDEENKKKGTVKTVRIPFKSIEQHFEGHQLTEDEICDIILKALENYRV